MMDVGGVEAFPKRILAFYDGQDQAGGFQDSTVYSLLAKLLGYLGYAFEYLDVHKGLPTYCLAGKYTGIVTRFNSEPLLQLKPWLMRPNDDGLKVVALGKY